MTSIRARLHAVPLRHRLVVVIVVLLGAGLFASGLTTALLLRTFLISQVDEQINATQRGLTPQALQSLISGAGDETMPSDYFVQVELRGHVERHIRPHTRNDFGTPQIDVPSSEELSHATDPETVGSDVPGVAWRARTFPVVEPLSGDVVGTFTVALPLGTVDETVARMAWLSSVIGFALVTLGAVAAWAAVRTAMRPLREIERTAASIAEGDLTQRVRPAPPSTEVGQLGLALNAMLTQIERSFLRQAASEARMRRFIADASHELRTPLATVRGYGELYRMGAIPEDDLPSAMGRIEKEAARMGALVSDLLQLARLDEGRPMTRRPVDLRVLASDAIADLRARSPQRPATVDSEAPGEGDEATQALVLGDEPALRQVLTNLVGNVDQHTPPSTPVEVSVAIDEDEVVVDVRDHGPGIGPQDSERIFERFVRLDDSRTRSSGGSGLGLAIVSAITAAHGGIVRALETPGGGTTMSVRLPLYREDRERQ